MIKRNKIFYVGTHKGEIFITTMTTPLYILERQKIDGLANNWIYIKSLSITLSKKFDRRYGFIIYLFIHYPPET